jgi:hypothetical protein
MREVIRMVNLSLSRQLFARDLPSYGVTADDYLQRVLPPGQHRVRYFGWMHPAAKARRIIVETLLAKPIVIAAPPPLPQWHLRCPHCGAFALVRVGTLARQARAPPLCAAA